MKPVHTPFVIGRIAPDGRRILVIQSTTPPPIPGPWEVRAIFTR